MKKWLMMVVAMVLLLTGCKTTEYVPIETVRTDTVKIAHIVTDTVFHRDTVVKESLTTVMQLDSAAMAKYGVQLKSAERAWLVKTKEMERIIQELMAKSQTHDTIYKSKTDTVKVEAVPRHTEKLTKWQKFRIKLANWLLWAVGALVVAIMVKFLWRLKNG